MIEGPTTTETTSVTHRSIRLLPIPEVKQTEKMTEIVERLGICEQMRPSRGHQGESGALTGAVNLLVDVSKRKQAEQDSRRLSAIVDSSEDAIVASSISRRPASARTAHR